MPEMSFDDQMQSAWIDYGLELSARLSAMRPGDVVTIAQSIDEVSENPHGHVTFTLTRGGRVRATVDDPDQLRDLIAAFLSSAMAADVKPTCEVVELPVMATLPVRRRAMHHQPRRHRVVGHEVCRRVRHPGTPA